MSENEESAGTAGPDVVDDKTPGTEVALVSTELEEYKDLIHGLNEMLKLKGIAYDLTTIKGNDRARKDRQMLKRTMTTIEKRCADKKRELKASVAEKIIRLESEAERFVGITEEIYNSADQQITADEQRRVREKAERDAAEAERQAGHRDRIADITNVAVRAVGMTSAQIQERIDMVARIVVGADFEEFEPHAVNAKAETLLKLADLLSIAKSSEQREAEAEANRLRLAQLERENAERITREAEERRQREAADVEQRRVADAQRAAEQRAADDRRARSDAASELVAEIDRIQRRAFTSSAAGLLELVTLIEHVAVGDELGEFAAVAVKARDKALHELHDFHRVVLQRETDQKTADAETRRLRDEQAAAAERTQMAMQQIDGIRQQLVIAHVGRIPYYTGANVDDVEKIIAETEAWLIDDANFGILVGSAQAVKDATLVSLRSYLAELVASRDAPPLVEQVADVKAALALADTPSGYVPAEMADVLHQGETIVIGVDMATGSDQTVHGALTDAADALPGGPGDGTLPVVLNEDTTRVPILIGFDQNKPVGWLEIRTSALPPTPDFVFSLGFQALGYAGEPGSVPSKRYFGDYQLQAISITSDEGYIGYLRQTGELHAADAPPEVFYDMKKYLETAGTLLAAVAAVMKSAALKPRAGKPGPWIVPHDEMAALKSALRAVPLTGGQFYAEDGTLMNADGTRSVFDDVDA